MTKIEWVRDPKTGLKGKTWNPVVGCTKLSAGCKNCYAETMAKRLKAMGRPEYQNTINGSGKWTGRVTLVPERLEEPLKRKKPTTYFVNSMSDLFHEDVPFDFILKTFSVMWQAHQHIFQVLTKRPARMLEFVKWMHDDEPSEPVADNVWLGVSIENQKTADERREAFRQIPAAVKFMSYEPALGLVDWRPWFECPVCAGTGEMYAPTGLDEMFEDFDVQPCGACGGSRYDPIIDWAIAGGESGLHARPMHPDWARSLRDQCHSAGVPFFFKQFGEYKEIQFDKRDREDILLSPTNGIIDRLPDPFNGNAQEFKRTVAMRPVGKKAAGRLLDGREYNEMPEVA